jgi:hypothetical protein
MYFVSIVAGALFSIVVAAMLAVPYCMLSGWSSGSFIWMVIGVPIMVSVWFALANQAGIIETDVLRGGKKTTRIYPKVAFGLEVNSSVPWALGAFWVWTVYCLLPIILHTASRLLYKVGEQRPATFLEMHRYGSLLGVPAAAITALALWSIIDGTVERLRGTGRELED